MTAAAGFGGGGSATSDGVAMSRKLFAEPVDVKETA
jgi:hypothetical protein